MGNALYDKGREKFLRGETAWQDDDIKSVLIDVADYTVDLVNDEFLDDIPSGARESVSGNVAGKTDTTAGVADCDDFAFVSVTGDPCEAVVFFKDTGDAATSPLISYHDTAVSGLPVTPNGGDIEIEVDSGANKLFKL